MRLETTGMTAGELVRAAALAAVAAGVLLWQPLFGGRSTQSFPLHDPRIDVRPWIALAPADDGTPPPLINPVTPDIDFFVLPGVARVAQLVEQGAQPWWDDSQLLGYPLAANQPYPLFSPLSWVTHVLDPISALDWLLWFHSAAAVWLAYRAARMLGAQPAAAAVAGVGFALSTWMITRWHLPQIMHTTTWWPGLVCAIEWWRRGRMARGMLEGAAFLGLSLLSGFPQVAVALAGGMLLLVLADRGLRRPGPVSASAGVFLIALLLAGTPVVLSGGAYEHSLRSSATARAEMAQQGLQPAALLGLPLPEFFGRMSDFAGPDPPAPTVREYLPRAQLLTDDLQDNVVENALYPGMLLLVLLPLLWARGVDRRARHLGSLAALALAACLVWPWVVARAPGIAGMGAGNIKRLLVLVACCLPLAGALALQGVLTGRAKVPWRATGLWVAGLLVLGWIAGGLTEHASGPEEARHFTMRLWWQVSRQVGLALLCVASLALAVRRGGAWKLLPAAILAADLAQMAFVFNPFPVQGPAFPPTETLVLLSAREGRVAVLGGDHVLPPSAAGLHGIRSVHGVAPMVPTRTAELLECIESPLLRPGDPRYVRAFRDPASLDHPILDLLGVTTVVHGDPAMLDALPWPLVTASEAEGLAVHDRPSGGPRAFLCGGAEVVAEKSERLARLAATGFDGHATVLLEEPPGTALPPAGPMVPARVLAESPLEIHLQVSATVPGIVVLTEAWDPGWQVRDNGRSAAVLVADHALLGVAVEAGEHEITWSYEPEGLGLSRVLRGVGIALLLLLAWRAGRQGASSNPSRNDMASSRSSTPGS